MFSNNEHIFSALTKTFWGITLLTAWLCLPPASYGENPPPAENTKDSRPQAVENYSAKVNELIRFLEGKSDSYSYQRTGRPDPFMPFIKQKVVTSEAKTPEKELVGLQKFEPGQLTLVAVVGTENGPLAMVQDSVGRGYIMKIGSAIGKSGVVDKITDNHVVIRQRYENIAGEERYKFVEMLLKKEGEKQQ